MARRAVAIDVDSGDVDVEIDDPGMSMAASTILNRAHRREEPRADPNSIVRLAARAERKGDPPERVLDWLADRGVEI